MIPMILIVWTVDVFYHFMQCPLHPEWSAPCGVIWILAGMYGFFLILTIICAIISNRMLKKVKRQIEDEFTESINNSTEKQIKEVKKTKPKKVVVKKDEKAETKKTVVKKAIKK